MDGYWHIPIHEKDQEKTGFATRQGLWQWRCMPMGLKNSSFTFQRAMQCVLRKHLWKHCMVYVDDIIIYSETIEEHMEHVRSQIRRFLGMTGYYRKFIKNYAHHS